MLYADAHCHTNPVKGLGADKIAKKFHELGGWFIALVALPPYHYGLEGGRLEDYEKVVRILENERKKVVEKGLRVRVFMGFHPAEVDEYFRRGMSLSKIIDLAEQVLDLVVRYSCEGVIDGIGEVGRQHYSTSPSRYVASELIMLMAFEKARDHGLPIHLHLEQGGYVTVKSVENFIELLNLERENVLFHHVDFDTGSICERHRLWHTVPAKIKDLRLSMSQRRNYVLVESDYIDDPKRPGVSSYPWDIVYNIEKLVRENIIEEDYVHRVMVDHITKFYHVEPP